MAKIYFLSFFYWKTIFPFLLSCIALVVCCVESDSQVFKMKSKLNSNVMSSVCVCAAGNQSPLRIRNSFRKNASQQRSKSATHLIWCRRNWHQIYLLVMCFNRGAKLLTIRSESNKSDLCCFSTWFDFGTSVTRKQRHDVTLQLSLFHIAQSLSLLRKFN